MWLVRARGDIVTRSRKAQIVPFRVRLLQSLVRCTVIVQHILADHQADMRVVCLIHSVDDSRNLVRIPVLVTRQSFEISRSAVNSLLVRLADRSNILNRRRRLLCPHSSWPQHGDLNSKRFNLLSKAAGKAAHGPFGALISGQPWVCAASADGGYLEDVARALLAKEWEGGLGDVDDAEEIGLVLGTDALDRSVLKCFKIGIASVVDDNINYADFLGGTVDAFLEDFVVVGVEGEREEMVWDVIVYKIVLRMMLCER